MQAATAKRLHDAISACDELQTYTSDWTRDEFLQTRSLQLIVWKLTEIVEEAILEAETTHPSLRSQVPDLGEAVTTMQQVTASYGTVDAALLWDVAVDETPVLRDRLAEAKREAPPVLVG